jgi:ribose/xylose/arabinose/galactoside ABC-type transport system permease subunit
MTRVVDGARRIAQAVWRTYRVGLFVVAVGLVLTLLTPRFFVEGNLVNVLTNAAVVAIVGLGMTLVIASGNFDLSVGATAAFAGAVSLSVVPTLGVAAGIAAGLITGAVVGFINGLIVAELRVPAFIATLGTLTILRGLTLIYTGGRDIYLVGETGYKILSSGAVPLVLALLVAAILAQVVARTRFGRHVLAVGSNQGAATRAGVRSNRILWAVFAVVGVTAALTGMIVSAQVLTANGRLDVGLELSAIAVVVIGGTPLTGGRATMIGTLLGALLIAEINNGLNLLNVPVFYQSLTTGALLLGAVGLSTAGRQFMQRAILPPISKAAK